MSEHEAVVLWSRHDGEPFTDGRYGRGHRWLFDGGVEVPASASPRVVPPPLSVAAAVDPEEAFVASLSSCHMLWFLSIAARRGFVVESYRDDAVGGMGRDESGRVLMTHVRLRPAARFGGDNLPGMDDVIAMHLEAHDRCYIARSVRIDVQCEPVWDGTASRALAPGLAR